MSGLRFDRATLADLTRHTPLEAPRFNTPQVIKAVHAVSPVMPSRQTPIGGYAGPTQAPTPSRARQAITAKTKAAISAFQTKREVPTNKKEPDNRLSPTVRDVKTCKERPDNSKRTRGSGHARREFVPWCDRK